MGQRTMPRTGRDSAARRAAAPRQGGAATELSVFPSALGWFALLGEDGRLVALTFGHATADAARRAMSDRLTELGTLHHRPFDGEWAERDWDSELRARLQRFAEGEPVEFDDCNVELPPMTEFQKRVMAAARRLRFGDTATYADLARRAGNPGAARAVGNVMRSNPVPLVIPCHRVVAAGKLGGYSAPQGVALKRTLLEMEAEALCGQ